MPARRSIIGRLLAGYLAAMCIVCSLPTSLAQVEGRKCVCTSKACKEAGVDTCKTRFFCYTERILTARQEIGESTVTRGCTEGATPLLCETKSWVTRSRSVNAVEPPAGPRVVVPWLKLKCCDNRDYCNADDDDDDEEDDDGANTRKRTQTERTHLDVTSTMQSDRKYDDSAESIDRLLRDRVRALHIAALVLAIAALISVLASCYVVTRDNWGYRGGPGEKSHVIPVTDDSGIRDPTYAYLTKLPEEQTNFTARSGLLCSTSYD